MKKLDEHNKLGFGLSILNPNGSIECSFNWERDLHSFSIPITIFEEFSWGNLLKATLIPTSLHLLFSMFFIRPFRKNTLSEIRRENYEINKQMEKKKKKWTQDNQKEILEKMLFEESRRGIVIMNAQFGVLDDEYSTKHQGYIDVTQTLQFYVKKSELCLSNFSTQEGFYDPAPGEKKQLEVVYKFHGKQHYVFINEDEELQMPLSKHLDE
jgi:DnaJ homolog subfamily C member 11